MVVFSLPCKAAPRDLLIGLVIVVLLG